MERMVYSTENGYRVDVPALVRMALRARIPREVLKPALQSYCLHSSDCGCFELKKIKEMS